MIQVGNLVTIANQLNYPQRALLVHPDCFIHPRLWSTYGNLLRTILVEKPEASAAAISLRPQMRRRYVRIKG